MLAILLMLAAADPIVGEWRGTSLCQVRPSPCNDEQAVYRIERTGDGYLVHFAKLVNGVAEEFGALPGTLDQRAGDLTVTGHDRSRRPFTWRLHVQGNRMSGSLRLPDGTLYRKAELTRVGT